MSLVADGRRILCDGVRCGAVSRVPVALRPTLTLSDRTTPAAEGWLFIRKQNAALHFCPVCARSYLAGSAETRKE